MKKKSCKHLLTCAAALMVILLPALVCAAPVPDTGQTKCYDNSWEIPCPQPGEAFYGQDAQYGTNTQSYTDLGNGVVSDNVTGLEWQQATAPGTYKWQQAIDYCNNLSLGGKDDWRLPTIKELSTLVDSGIPYPGPTINTSYFPDTVTFGYWSSTTRADDSSFAWGVNFVDGSVDYYGYKNHYSYVRAVRGGQTNNSFVDNSDGTISDTSTGLMWQKATAPGTYTWEQALTYCENLTLANKNDWRLSNRNELQSIVDYSRYNPAIYTTFFPGTVADYYWSSTTYADNISLAWGVYFFYGYVGSYNKGSYYYFRAVRGGQCGSTVIKLSSFTATPKSDKVILKWNTASEIDNAGFIIYCAESENGQYIKINTSLIPAEGSSTQGANYEFIDNDVQNRKTYYYKLEDIDTKGISTFHGPVKATPRWIYGAGK